MTTSDLEIKDGIPEILQPHNELPYFTKEQPSSSATENLVKQLGNIAIKFDQYINRLDSRELAHKDMSLKEEPEALHCTSLKAYMTKGESAESTTPSNETSSETLSFLMPRKTSLDIDKLLAKSSVMRKLCSVEKISGDSLEHLTTNNKDTFAGWVGETAISDSTSTPKIYKTTIYLHELYAQPQISKKLLEDSFIDVENWLINHLVDAFSRIENKAFISGNNLKSPTGILSYKTGTGTGEIEHIKATAFNADAIISLYYALSEYFASRAVFLMHRSVLQTIRSLKSSSGQYLLQRGPRGEELLLGMPVYQTSDMPLTNNNEIPIIAFADFKAAYKIVENHEMSILRDPFTSKSFVKFYTTKRVGGSLVNGDAIKMLTIAKT